MHVAKIGAASVMLCLGLFLGSGCAARQSQPATSAVAPSIERPARPLGEEETLADQIGQVGVVLLVIGVTVGGILLPVLLL